VVTVLVCSRAVGAAAQRLSPSAPDCSAYQRGANVAYLGPVALAPPEENVSQTASNQPKDVRLARAALVALQAAQGQEARDVSWYQIGDGPTLTFDDAVSRLAGTTKPVACSAHILDGVLVVNVRQMTTADDRVVLHALEQQVLPLQAQEIRERGGNSGDSAVAIHGLDADVVLSLEEFMEWQRIYDVQASMALHTADSAASRSGAVAVASFGAD
jgi:hypothetical protein